MPNSTAPLLRQEFTAVLGVRTRDELLKEVLRFARFSGFELVSAMAVIDGIDSKPRFIVVHNTPAGFKDTFLNLEMARRDPVMPALQMEQRAHRLGTGTYVSAQMGPNWEHQAAFGYKAGIAVAMHLPKGQHFFIGIDRDGALPTNDRELTRLVADLQLFAAYAQDAALRILLPESAPDVPQLSMRELECLRWTMEGKTAWELGHIVGISEQTRLVMSTTLPRNSVASTSCKRP